MKLILAGFQTHLDGEVTSLAHLWTVTRVDGTVFHFTDHDKDVEFGDTFVAAVGYNRTTIDSKSGLNVDNLEANGFLDSSALTEADLRGKKWDYAEYKIELVNWKDTALETGKLRKGKFGQILYSEIDGTFSVELRGLMSPLQQPFLPIYQPECRVDLGSPECGIPIWPDIDERLTEYTTVNARLLPDYVRASNVIPSPDTGFILSFDGDFIDGGVNRHAPTLQGGSLGFVSPGKFGQAALFAPAIRQDETYRLSYDSSIGKFAVNEKFTIECNYRDTISPSQALTGILVGCNQNTDNNDWALLRDETGIIFRTHDVSDVVEIELIGNHPGGVDNGLDWHHAAVTRDDLDNYNLWLDGVLVDSVTDAAVISHEPNTSFNVGHGNSGQAVFVLGVAGGGSSSEPVEVDNIRVLHGIEQYTANFTPPTAPFETFSDYNSIDLGNVYYECTTSGTTAGSRPTFDPNPGSETIDDTVVWTAREAWTRTGTVDAVTDNRIFNTLIDEDRAVDGWFQFGALTFETGANIGQTMEVKQYTEADLSSTGILTLTGQPLNTETVTIGGVAIAAITTWTATANALDTETVTIDAKVYTFEDTLSNFDGNVHIGATASDTLDNLIDAINLGAGVGVDYATDMTLHPTVSALAGTGDTMDLTAKTAGVAGNDLVSSDSVLGATFPDGTFSGGKDDDQKIYTFQITLTPTTGVNNVLIGGTASDSIDNLIAAIEKASGGGTTYGSGTLAHLTVTAVAGTGDTMDVTSRTASATGSLTLTNTGPFDKETLTIDEKIYTFLNTLDNRDGNVLIDPDDIIVSLSRLADAINLDSGAGTTYANDMVVHPTVSAVANNLVLTVTAKTSGLAGNTILTAEGISGGTWGSTTLLGGLAAAGGSTNLIPTTQTLTSGTWGAATLLGATTDRGLTELFLNMPFTIQVGDEFRIHAGCDKKLVTCRDKFDNIEMRRAEDFLPGQGQIRRTPDSRS